MWPLNVLPRQLRCGILDVDQAVAESRNINLYICNVSVYYHLKARKFSFYLEMWALFPNKNTLTFANRGPLTTPKGVMMGQGQMPDIVPDQKRTLNPLHRGINKRSDMLLNRLRTL